MAKQANTPDYTAEEKKQFVTELCVEVSDSKDGLDPICVRLRKRNGRFPVRKTFYTWFSADDELRKRFDAAKKDQANNWFDEIVNIFNKLDKPELSTSDVQRLRLKFDVIRWATAKLDPYKYGDNVQMKLAELEQKLEKYEALFNGRK